MLNRRTRKQVPARHGALSPGKWSRWRSGVRVQVAAFAMLLTLAVGIVSAADVCKLSVCWFNEQDKNSFECRQGCYFEESPLDASNAAQCTSLARPGHESDILHMYRDNSSQCTGGCITIGIGNLLRTADDAAALHGMFMINDANGQQRVATEQEIRDEFNGLTQQPAGCTPDTPNQCNKATYYARETNLLISKESSNQLCQGRLDNEFVAGLINEFGQDAWNNMPTRVQYAMVDIVYNVGVSKFRNGWPNFRAAIRNQDWATAAAESNRKAPVSDARNAYVRGLLETAAQGDQAGAARLARCPLLP